MRLLRNTLLITAMGGLLALTLASNAFASTVTFNYNAVISGSTPAGTAPWVQAIFDDGGSSGSVTLTMTTSGLSGSENITGMYFNLDSSLNPTSLSFNYLGTTGAAATSVQTGVDAFKADGDGKYDVLFNFPTASGFNAGQTVKYQITGISSLTALSFNVLSACGNPSCSGPGNFYAAAKVQNIGASSGWIASNAGVVPVPAALWLFGSGLVGLAAAVRRKKST